MIKPNWQPTKAAYWKHLPPPARPWPSEVAWFEKYVLEKKKKGKKDVLILGSTVEFRSMLHKNKMKVYVVDFSKKFFKILSKQPMRYKGPEVFYEQNWLTMNLGKKFDLIFGDWVPNVIHSKEYYKFFKQILKHLKPDGLFIGREALRPNQTKVDLKKVLFRHYHNYSAQYSFYESSMHYIYGYRPDPKTAMWNMAKSKQAVEDAHTKGLFKKEIDYQQVHDALAIEKDGSMSMMIKGNFERIAKIYFKILAEHHVTEPSSDWFPIYVMRKK